MAKSIRDQAPFAVAFTAKCAIYFLNDWFMRTGETEANATTVRCHLLLSRQVHRKKRLPQARNMVREVFGQSGWQLEREDDYAETYLTRSPTLYVFLTPDCQYYVSTHPDRDHMLHEGLIPPDANAQDTISEIMCNYWKDWMRRADEILRRQP